MDSLITAGRGHSPVQGLQIEMLLYRHQMTKNRQPGNSKSFSINETLFFEFLKCIKNTYKNTFLRTKKNIFI
jgi:hypothetical protein